jgi:hypothetical protein
MSDERIEFLYMTSTGWKSGKPHEIEIWFVEHEGKYYIVAETRERAHWVQNIQRNPAISFRVDGVEYVGVGRVIAADDELAAPVSNKMDIKYGWSDGLIVELAPNEG